MYSIFSNLGFACLGFPDLITFPSFHKEELEDLADTSGIEFQCWGYA